MKDTSFYHFYQCNRPQDSGGIVIIESYFKPSLKKRPKSGTWILKEYEDGRWFFSGEITWGTLKQLDYIGKVRK